MYESASNIWISLDLRFFQDGCLSSCLLYMYESSLLTYLHIPSVFHNQRPCNGYRELILPWKTTAQQDRLFYFFGVAVRFDWIKIDVWIKLGVLNYSSRPKLSLGSPMWSTAFDPGLSHCGSRSSENTEFVNFALLFCRERQINVQRIITHEQSHCFAH